MLNKSCITVVILTHNSYKDKAGSVELVIQAYLNQTIQPAKIIVVDNGSNEINQARLKAFCADKPLVQVLTTNQTIGGTRNYGANHVSNGYILFNDDDTIPLQNNVIARLGQYANTGKYGYGANRLWSPDLGWVSKNRELILSSIKTGNMARLKSFGCIPEPGIRDKSQNTLKILLKSFIGNFGLISKADFEVVGGFPEYPGYACEDDAFAFLCYIKLGVPMIFDDIELLHITHPIGEKSYEQALTNQQRLQKLLEKNGCSEFHISRILFKSSQPVLKRIEETHGA